MKLLTYLLLTGLLLPIIQPSSYAQKRIKTFNDERVKRVKKKLAKSEKVIYYVLDSDPNLFHGPFLIKGKETDWVSGQYDQGKPIGKWQFSNDHGLFQEYDFTTDSFTLRTFEDKKIPFGMPIGLDSTNFSKFDLEATAIGGSNRVNDYIQSHLNIPMKVRNNDNSSYCSFLVYLNEIGEVTKAEIIDCPLKEYEAACKKAIQSVTDLKFYPAVLDGKAVESVFGMTLIIPGQYLKEINTFYVHPIISSGTKKALHD
ncbi:MAG: hypothetical protein R2769_03110 [Saprospiraceae bacterium]